MRLRDQIFTLTRQNEKLEEDLRNARDKVKQGEEQRDKQVKALQDEVKKLKESPSVSIEGSSSSPLSQESDSGLVQLNVTLNQLKQDLFEQQQRSGMLPQSQQTAKQLQDKINDLKKELERETKTRIELQEKIAKLESSQTKLKEQLQTTGRATLSDQKNEKLATLETIVKLEKDMKLLKEELEIKKKQIADLNESETEFRKQKNLMNQYLQSSSASITTKGTSKNSKMRRPSCSRR